MSPPNASRIADSIFPAKLRFACARNRAGGSLTCVRTGSCHSRILPAIVPGDGKRTVSLNSSAQLVGGGAKKQRRVPSGRLQRQKAPSGLGWASL